MAKEIIGVMSYDRVIVARRAQLMMKTKQPWKVKKHVKLRVD